MIDHSTIYEIIQEFYQIAKKDVLIGYHFRVIEDFDEHIPRIVDFWNLQINGEMKDRSHLPFQLIEKHIPLKVNKGEIHRWEKLFHENLQIFKNKDFITEDKVQLWMRKVEHFKKILLAKL